MRKAKASDMETILVLYVGIGLLLILVAIPLIRKKIKPNHLYGFRVPQTLNDPEVWYCLLYTSRCV